MFFSETRIAANPPGAVPLSRDQIWQGLEQKAFDAVPYVEAITECRVIDRKSESVFDREATIGGHRYVERVWLEPPNRIAFTRLDGPVLGTITNEIVEDGDTLAVVFQFALAVRPGHTIPVTEQELSAQMVSAYQTAVETTLAAVRAGLRTGDTIPMTASRPAGAADAPAWLVDFYKKVDALDVDAVVASFAAGGVMRFGSNDPLAGHDALRAGMAWVFSNYRRMTHDFANVWVNGDTALLEATVSYELPDGKVVPLPVLTVIERRDGEIENLRIFSEPIPLKSE
jgi:Domain of unknown function (DUF1857)/SnoaL-like domain